MTRFRSLAAGVLVAVVLASGAALAQGPGRPAGPGGRGGRPGGPGGPGGPGDLGLPLAQLNLTDSQRQQIRELTQRRLPDGQPVQERLRTAMDARRAAMDTIPVNEGAIRATAADLAAAETEAAILQAHLRADVFALLTPEQQDQAKKLQAQRDARVDDRRERLDDRLNRAQKRQNGQQQ
jgi:Spy/CpxP family protein refolding chaperone